MFFQANSTVSGRGSPLRETSNVGPAAFTQEGEVPPDHPGDKELVLYQPLPFAVAFEYTAGVDGGESGDGGSPYPKGGGELMLYQPLPFVMVVQDAAGVDGGESGDGGSPYPKGGGELMLYQPLPFGMIVQDTAGVDGGESGDGGSPHPKGGGELMLYQPLPFGMIVQDTEGVDGGESRDGGSARAVVPDAIGTSAWVPEGPPSHMAVVASDDGAEGELHSLREVSLPLVRWSDRRITEPPHPAMVGVVSALFTAAVFLCCQWRSRRTRLRQQALALARQHALRRVIRRNADRSRRLKVSAIWRWRLSAASGAVADLRAQRERTAEEHEAARATDREAAEQRRIEAVGVATAVETARRESIETTLAEVRESLFDRQREVSDARHGVTEARAALSSAGERHQQQLRETE
ncbi:unnamed protein product, partial [Ectocarpus fasciculatus]